MPRPHRDTRVERELKAFVVDRLPAFRAPTDAAAWRREVPRLRRKALAEVYLRGYPRSVIDAPPRMVWGETLRPDPAYAIRKLRYEAYPNYWVPALLYEPTDSSKPRRAGSSRAKLPVVFNPNGHHPGGKAATYKQARCINLARRGMLALSTEFIGMGELEADRDHNQQGHLGLTGMAGVGLFYLAMKKGLDVLLADPRADRERVCATGLSGGGWQSLVLAALDPRVTACCPVAGYTVLRPGPEWPHYGDLEQTPPEQAAVADYPRLTAMLAPRPTLVILNEKDDCCFPTAKAKPVIYDAVVPTYRAFGAEADFTFYSHRDPGTHNYGADNRRQLYKFLNRHFGLDTPEHDLHREDEILTETELRVGLPDEQETLLTLALGRARRLAAGRRPPATPAQRRALRARLAEVIRLPAYPARASRSGRASGNRRREEWTLKVGPWTVPMTAHVATQRSHAAALVISDVGRRGYAWPRPDGATTFVADLLGTGENRLIPGLGMLLESAGARLLGVQVAQVHACAAFAARRAGVERLRLEGVGPLAGVVALLAAALRPELFSRLRVTQEIATLRYLMQWPMTHEAVQSLYCFGLLEVGDVDDFKALLEGVVYDAAGREVKLAVPGAFIDRRSSAAKRRRKA